MAAINADRGQYKKKVGLDKGFTAARGQRTAAWGRLWGHVEREPRVSPLAAWCALYCAIPSTSHRRATVPPLSVCSNKLTTCDYVEGLSIVRRAWVWGIVVAPMSKDGTTGQVTVTFMRWRRKGVEVTWGIVGVFPRQDETACHRTQQGHPSFRQTRTRTCEGECGRHCG